jgi:hypothetical protein
LITGKYFAYAAELLKLQPPHLTDEPIIAQMKRIGIEPGKSFDIDKAGPAVKKGLEGAPEEAQKLMEWKTATLARVANHWSMNTDTMGVYGNYYLKRAIVAQVGLGANLPEDAIYPLNLGGEAGRPLDGTSKYSIHFEKGAPPPVNAFWSITLYDREGFQVANSLNRFAVSSWMPFKYNADGSLDLYFQNEGPGRDKEANWLPSPKGAFNLTMRLYAPKSDALTGKWNSPPITRVQELPALTVARTPFFRVAFSPPPGRNGVSVANAMSIACSRSSASSIAAKSGSRLSEIGLPLVTPGVQIWTSAHARYASALATSSSLQDSGRVGHTSPRRDRSLLRSSTIDGIPSNAASSTIRRKSTVLPEPGPARTAIWRGSKSVASVTGSPSAPRS